jgi:hypothetical protein
VGKVYHLVHDQKGESDTSHPLEAPAANDRTFSDLTLIETDYFSNPEI